MLLSISQGQEKSVIDASDRYLAECAPLVLGIIENGIDEGTLEDMVPPKNRICLRFLLVDVKNCPSALRFINDHLLPIPACGVPVLGSLKLPLFFFFLAAVVSNI